MEKPTERQARGRVTEQMRPYTKKEHEIRVST